MDTIVMQEIYSAKTLQNLSFLKGKGSLKVAVFWDVAPYSITADLFHFEDDDYKTTDVLKKIIEQYMNLINSSKMSVNIFQTIWFHIPEDSHLPTHCLEKLKSQKCSLCICATGKDYKTNINK
jgi:hypothetical protein